LPVRTAAQVLGLHEKKDVEKHDGSAVEEDARRESAAEEAHWQGLQYVWDFPQSHAVRKKAQIGTAWAQTHVPRFIF